jgi:hypothetical protein
VIGNPVLHKELFMRLRLRQVPLGAKIGIAIVILTCLGLFYSVVGKILLDNPNEDVGRAAWTWCIGIQYTLVCLIAPVITANCITQEKEQQTWEMLVFTRLKPGEIILGKLISRLAIVFIVLALFLPLTLFCWIHSAVMDTHSSGTSKVAEFVMSYGVIVISTIFFATFGLFMSWQLRKTLFAIMLSYTFVIGFLLIGTTLIYVALQSRFSDSSFLVKCPLMWINPVYLIFYAFAPDNSSNSTLFVIYGLLCYIVGTLVMLWRMILGFYHFTYDDDDDSTGPLAAITGKLGSMVRGQKATMKE